MLPQAHFSNGLEKLGVHPYKYEYTGTSQKLEYNEKG